MLVTPQLQHKLMEGKGMVGILRGSPKRKRRDSTEEIGVGFEPQLSGRSNETGSSNQSNPDANPDAELEKARRFAEINSHLKGERFSPKILVTPKLPSQDMRRPEILGMNMPGRLVVGGDMGGLGRAGLEEVEDGSSSPRTTVAEKLRELELQRPSLREVPVLRFGEQGEGKERKKIRLEGFEDVSSHNRAEEEEEQEESGDGFSPRRAGGGKTNWHHSLSFREKSGEARMLEIPETPQPQPQPPAPNSHRGSPPPPTTSPFPTKCQLPTTILPATTFQPPDTSTSPPDTPSNGMTWQDSEITGHLALDPDDDGYGVNGIGFRPTPAMAYARSQRRRQQILEWKNREGREARGRRAEERKRGMKNGDGGVEGKGGRVRFLE